MWIKPASGGEPAYFLYAINEPHVSFERPPGVFSLALPRSLPSFVSIERSIVEKRARPASGRLGDRHRPPQQLRKTRILRGLPAVSVFQLRLE